MLIQNTLKLYGELVIKLMKNKKIWNTLTKTIFTRLFVTLVIYTVILLLIFILSETFLSLFTWRGTETLYPLLNFISKNKNAIITILWVTGFVIIFLYYLYKSLKYMDILIDASSELVDSNEELIELPSELNDVEKRMNEIKQKAIKNAKKAMENEQKKNDLIVYLAHDIKTPLTSIIGYLSLLTDEKEISEKTRQKYLNITLDKSYKLENLINELFDVARYNSENIILEKEELNINLMIQQIIDEFYPMLKEQDKKINLSFNKNITYNGDPNKLARVFNNIIKNAINYSFQKSTIEVYLSEDDKEVIIKIKNKGKKISDSELGKIFDRFYRIDKSRTSEKGGAGLGLAIAKDIVELHNGTINVLSSDKETIFTVHLPLAD